MRCIILEAGCLLATPTSSWQHHIEPQSAFPQQFLQITKLFSLCPSTFLSTKTNELTLILTGWNYKPRLLEGRVLVIHQDQSWC